MRREGGGPGGHLSPYTGGSLGQLPVELWSPGGRDQGGGPAVPSHAFLTHKGSADLGCPPIQNAAITRITKITQATKMIKLTK